MSHPACAALGQVTELPAASITHGNRQVIAAMEIDRTEIARRRALGIGAITDTALLHGLWLLPHGIECPLSSEHDHKADRIRDAPYAAIADGNLFVRTYQPPGTVRAVAVADRSIPSGARRVHPWVSTIFERWIVLREPPKRMSAIAGRLTSMHGIGVIAANADSGAAAMVIRQPAPPVVGIPHVYRWWIAEVVWDALREVGTGTPVARVR